MPRIRIFGHRGASAKCPENTLAAFRRAVADGADGIELDVRAGAHGALVVCHDPRLGDGRLVRDVPSAALPEGVPVLDEVLAAGDWYLNIEVKNGLRDEGHVPGPALARAVVGAVAAHGARDRVIVSSFDRATLEQVRAADPDLPRGWLVHDRTRLGPDELVSAAVDLGCTAVHPADALVDGSLVGAAHRAGLQVAVWTVDDPSRIRALADLGVDVVITNDPSAAITALAG